jgi:hypothetical protein
MSDSILSFVNSASFRNTLIARNLPPYTLNGLYTPPSGLQNYEVSVSDFNVVDSPNELISQNPFVRNNQTLNEYGPNNGYQNTIINNNLPVTPNQGEYNLNDTVLDLVNEFYIDLAYIENRYGPVGGFNNMVVIDSIQNNNKIYVPYWDPPTFIPSSYSPYNILLSNNPTGSNGLLSQDSYIAKLGAESLKFAIQARIDAELFQRTLGAVNLDVLSDPFEAGLVATGREPLIYRDYRITVPENPITAGAELTLRLTGAYLPFSLIPGDYFLENVPGAGSTQINRALNVINKLTGGFLGPILNTTRNPSEIFLANTGSGQRSVLFQTINYNKYQPFYERGFGQLLQSALGSINPENGTIVGKYYVGSRTAEPSTITSPPNQIPVNASGKQVQTDVYGPSELGILYEGNQNRLNFGLAGKSFSDDGGIVGRFVWTSPKYKGGAGYKATVGGGKGSLDKEFNAITAQYNRDESTNLTFKQDSILDSTQRLIESADNVAGETRLKHVGNAINQVSKVFNDGYKEITKGSKVVSYTDNTTGEQRGIEYCRIFTKDTPYYTYADLQKTDGITTSGRRFNNSILDNTYNLNIAPIKGDNSTNIVKDARGKLVAKKYMFSIENLAWRTSSRPGYTYDDLPVCEQGPNGGRVMWFPPYNLTFSDSSSPTFNATSFIGRPEPIYTYQNTSRNGTLGWTIIVDNPSVTNLLVDEQLRNRNDERINSIMDSFFAGCVKYDIYALAKKFNKIPSSDLFTYQEILNNPRLTAEEYEGVVKSVSKENVTAGQVGDTDPTKKTESPDPRAEQIKNDFQNLAFYFENDVPGPSNANSTTTTLLYQDIFATYTATTNISQYESISRNTFAPNLYYCQLSGNIPENLIGSGVTVTYSQYCERAKKTTEFFNTVIVPQFNKVVNEFIPRVYEVLNANPKNSISINMVGSASALGDNNYNVSLSKRRVDSIKRFLETYDVGGVKLKQFFDSKQIIINSEEKGEEISIPTAESGIAGFEVNCTSNVRDGNGGIGNGTIYSVNAMACRRVRIANIICKLENIVTVVEGEADPVKQQEVIKIKPIPRVQPTVDVIKKVKEGISKKILRNLLTECDYFELIEEKAPMVYASFKEKIKYFNPAFHSMTPEGLNARLTFLNQCVRPGETIPIIGTDGKPKYNDAINTSFGTPPILVLRIGDFYHTKIVPTSLSFSYDNTILDLNPEGIGVQPMIVKVTMNFNIIGGMGLAKPVEQLQNALSFNYYANTEIYDERATWTEDTSALDKEIVDKIVGSQSPATINNVNNVIPNNGGNTIGTIITNIPITNGQSGETSYQAIMDTLLKETTNYMNLVTNKLESINNTYNYGVVQLLNEGRVPSVILTLNDPFQPPPQQNKVQIFGNPKYESLMQQAFTEISEDIDGDANPIINQLNDISGFGTILPQVKENLKKYIKNLESEFSNGIATIVQELNEGQAIFTKVIEKINIVVGTEINPENGLDGKILETGVPRLYRVTGIPNPPVLGELPSTTKKVLIGDFNKLYTVLEEKIDETTPKSFVPILSNAEITFIETYEKGNFKVKTNKLTTKSEKQFFMVMSRIITNPTKKQKFIDEVISGNLKTYKTPVSLLNKFEKIVNQLENIYKNELDAEQKLFKDLRKNKDFKNLIDGVEEFMYVLGKPRKFEYTTAAEFTQEEKDKIINLYK